jgi:hypothetical protein
VRLNRIGKGNSSFFWGQEFIDGRADFFDFFAWVVYPMNLPSKQTSLAPPSRAEALQRRPF